MNSSLLDMAGPSRCLIWGGALRAADVSLLYTGTGGKDNRNFPPGSLGTGQAAGENNSLKALTKGRRDGYNLIKNCPRV